jgi:hypothetical protein
MPSQKTETPANIKAVTSVPTTTVAKQPEITSPSPENNNTVVSTTNEPPVNSAETAVVKNDKELKKETASNEKTIKLKTENKNSNTVGEDALTKSKQSVIGMGNEPVFGDMLDSSKGIINETKEREETKKAAKTKTYPIGWNNFMLSNVNPDSIKNYHERMQKDSLKSNEN